MSKVEKALEKLAGIGYGGPHYGERAIYDSPYDPDAWDAEGNEIGKPVNIQAGLPSGTRRFLAARGIPMEEKARKYKQAIRAISEQEKLDETKNALQAGGYGAGIGGALGAALGIGGESKHPVLKGLGIGAAVGGGLFALLGAVGAAIKNDDIDEAKAVLKSSRVNDTLKEGLLEEISRVEYEKHLERKPWYRG